MAFDLKTLDDGKILGGVGGVGVTIVDVYHHELNNGKVQMAFRCKVGSLLNNSHKEEGSDDDYENISEDVVDIKEFTPDEGSDKYAQELSRVNRLLTVLSGQVVTDPEAWHDAVTEDGELRKAILDNTDCKVYIRNKIKNGYANPNFATDVCTPKKLNIIEFKAMMANKKKAVSSVF